jgi:hypothetical protein
MGTSFTCCVTVETPGSEPTFTEAKQLFFDLPLQREVSEAYSDATVVPKE